MLHRSKYYIVSTMMVTVFSQTDRIMLKLMLNESETGYYSAAINCINVTAFVFAAIIDSMRPTILEAKIEKNNTRFENQMVMLYSVITYLSLLQSLVMTIFAGVFVCLLYGSEFMAAAGALRIAVWYVTFSNYGMVRNIWILAENKQKYLWRINLSGALINVVLNFALIPYFGAAGAAAASLVTQFFTNVIIGYIIKDIRFNNRLMIKGLDPRPMFAYAKRVLKRK